MSNLTASRASNRAALANRERREVVVQHELFAVLIHQPIDSLLVPGRSQGDRYQRLGLTALKQG